VSRKRRGDAWANAVQAGALKVWDLHAAEAVCHKTVVQRSRYQQSMSLKWIPPKERK